MFIWDETSIRNCEIHSSSTRLSALIECVALAQTSELGRHGAF